MSFQLRVLGGLSLAGHDGPVAGRAAQRHRLALLALLAHAGERGISREKLAGYLWGGTNEEHARKLLSDSVYRIHKKLGAEAVHATGDLLRIDANVVPSDLVEFRDALEREDWARAVDAYAGPFLDGFHLPDAPEFERWLDTARAELARDFSAALEALANERAEAGFAAEAAALWQKRAAVDPYDARVATSLMRALDAAGNRAGALRHARVHAQLLESEFGTGPDADVEALAEALRSSPAAERATPVRTAVSGPASGADFVVAVERDPVAAPTAPQTQGRPDRPARPRRRPLAVAAIGLALVGLAALVGTGAWLSTRAAPDAPPTPASDRIAIAVLPFDNLSADEQGLFFTEGVTEDVLTRLSTIDGFSVIARASVMPYRDSPKSVPDIARELDVRYIVHGSVRHANDGVRITAQLVDGRTSANVWAQTYDRRVEDIFTVQTDIATRVATALQAQLTPRVAADLDRVPTEDLAAYNAYLRGRFEWHLRTEDGLLRSVAFFEEAVARDPAFARAWAGLADAYAVLAFYDYLPPGEAYPKARDAALRALEIDERLAEAHASLGYITLYHEWDTDRAEAAFRRSIELNPSYSTGHQWYANLLVATGRFDEAERAMNRARETNPLSLIANGALGWVYYHAGRYEEALRQSDLALEMDPSWDLAYLWRGLALEGMGRLEEAIASHDRAVALSGGTGISVASLAHAHARSGDEEEARATLVRLLAEREEGRYRPSFEIAKVHVALGEHDEALGWLERAYQEGSHSMVFLEVDPQLAPLQQDARFRELVERVEAGGSEG
jgi:TolB-like protein/DNA-binding SARP family transcriptional activator/tetratricopeptide (TPR) repeat protein